MKLEVGVYVRTTGGFIYKNENGEEFYEDSVDVGIGIIPDVDGIWLDKEHFNYVDKRDITKVSNNITDLIEYMDILVIENKLKDINNREIYLFNPVRCDGFTTFGDGKRCMIINMDYIIPIENIKVYQVLTHELFESMSYKVGELNEN